MPYVRVEVPGEINENFEQLAARVKRDEEALASRLQEAVVGVEAIDRSKRDVKVTMIPVFGNHIRAEVLMASDKKRTKHALQKVAERVNAILADHYGNWHVDTLVRTFSPYQTGAAISYSK
jgi:phenylpyruvate tautomerase PptA (4-oxalocrotonate tautomerase family)